jgi:ribose transport system substrate-binding protein
MKKSRFLILSALTALSLAACNKTETTTIPLPKGETKGKIGMTCMDLTNPFFKLIANIMEEEAAKVGYALVATDGAKDAAVQNAQVADFIAQKCSAIFLNPADSKAAAESVRKAHEAGIPVFTFDVQIGDEEARELVTAHIGSDNFQGGQLAGESMMKATNNQGKVAIIGLPEVSSCILRVDGFKDYLAKNGSKLEIVAELSGKGNRNDGYSVASDILQANPDIVGIFAINDPSALGAAEAVAKVDASDRITIVAFDASPSGKQGVFDKKLFDTPQQFPRRMAEGTVASFVKYLDGDAVEKLDLIPCEHYYYEDSVKDESREKEQW